ncbi:cell division protein FtsK [Campylobacter lari]|uniref:FtsK/SpoIIIE family DNA translocase n=1 Tax=Campylobacter lari TaxID=201 RepID=UPI0021E696B0|nr:DNA translocase FtsK [Campylobacter lari]MCV3468435.1 cell division protein FtsK [Campylobacter lari]MCV3483676.1 cell division protein FtsK [Campylobacter lari]MCV3489882.1 cell division protein FtsK [Campylobacter lari]MCV3491334.1 cell division protein FtsK [Campylobacter lari]MCV3495758.1 cell division protein FtsK [Campylobacter lari]
MGYSLAKLSYFLFGSLTKFYPFVFFWFNYLLYKNDYNLELIERRFSVAIFTCILASLIFASAFLQDKGYIASAMFVILDGLFGKIGSLILVVLLLAFAFSISFPKFIKEVFKVELDFDFYLKLETLIKNKIFGFFGGDKYENETKEEQEKLKQELLIKEKKEEPIKNEELPKQETQENKKFNLEDLKNQELEEVIISEEDKKLSSSYIHELSEPIASFAQKASQINIKEDEMTPEEYLSKYKNNSEDIYTQTLKSKNLDEPSYKRRNMDLNENKEEIIEENSLFAKELKEREQMLQKAKLLEEYKALQKEKILEELNEDFKKIEELNAIEAQKEAEFKKIQNKTSFLGVKDFKDEDFIPQNEVKELDFSEDDFTKPLSIEELRSKKELQNPFIVEEIQNEVKEENNAFEIKEIKNEELENKTHHSITSEISENKALLKDLDFGNFEKPKDFILPPLDFLSMPKEGKNEINEEEIDRKIYDLLEKLRRFKIGGDVVRTYTGPVVTTFEFRPAADVKVSKILSLQDDLAMALKAQTIRIQAPIPGKDVVGIEVPNEKIDTIYLREILESDVFKNSSSPLTIALGKDIVGDPFITDLKKLPHLLIAGTTGSGKSVGINSMLLSLLYRNSPKTLRLMMIDPKMLEFSIYNDIPHLLTSVITDPKKAVNALSNMVAEMERRYRLMAEAKTKNIENYNEKIKDQGGEILPFIVVIIDELADLMMTAGKDVEFYIGRLAQMARASGIHLIVATQRPSVDVVTGVVKANLPSRISYKVGQKIDSKVILDAMGAESLLGRGDCLFTPPGMSSLVRLHAPFASENEIENIVEFLKEQQVVEYDESFLKDENSDFNARRNDFSDGDLDELYEEAKAIVLEDRKTSISYIQRRLKIGYNRAANIVEQLTQMGVLSEPDAKGQREIL